MPWECYICGKSNFTPEHIKNCQATNNRCKFFKIVEYVEKCGVPTSSERVVATIEEQDFYPNNAKGKLHQWGYWRRRIGRQRRATSSAKIWERKQILLNGRDDVWTVLQGNSIYGLACSNFHRTQFEENHWWKKLWSEIWFKRAIIGLWKRTAGFTGLPIGSIRGSGSNGIQSKSATGSELREVNSTRRLASCSSLQHPSINRKGWVQSKHTNTKLRPGGKWNKSRRKAKTLSPETNWGVSKIVPKKRSC